jgi:murein L,D-transpeptidase YcbB/YkuD
VSPGIFLFLGLSLLLHPADVPAEGLSDQLTVCLADRISLKNGNQDIFCHTSKLVCGSDLLRRFYERREYRPAWITDDGIRPDASTLMGVINQADGEGLRPDDYHLISIQEFLCRPIDVGTEIARADCERLADLDLLLTDAFLLYGSHLASGRVNPETIRSEWFIRNREVDLVKALQEAVDEGKIQRALDLMRPRNAEYSEMKEALLTYREIEERGGWPVVANGPLLRKGDRGGRVAALRSRLEVSQDLIATGEEGKDLFDRKLNQAVLRFQERHGLIADGLVGPATLAALNVPAGDRLRQIELNMERWRWLPRDFGHRYLLINTAAYQLFVIENEQAVLKMRVIVGTRYRKTPVFTGKMIYMELNPYWHVPPRIAKEDILPRIRKDPQYLADQNIRVFQGWQANAPEVDPVFVDWAQVKPRNFSFKLRQDPGPSNALGRIKFMLPNKFDVYLHDTPAREQFKRPQRNFSSGCIRIEKPVELAEYLLRADRTWSNERILASIETRKTQIVRLPEPIVTHVLYLTAWVDPSETVHFRDDIYGRDGILVKALNERPPTGQPRPSQ